MSDKYNKCSKKLNTFLYLSLNKILVIRTGIHKCLSECKQRRLRSDFFFKSSLILVCAVCLAIFGRYLVFKFYSIYHDSRSFPFLHFKFLKAYISKFTKHVELSVYLIFVHNFSKFFIFVKEDKTLYTKTYFFNL